MSEAIDPRRPESTDAEVGRLVRTLRMARGLSQTEFGNRIGVTFHQIQKYESGANRISMGRLTRIAHVLGVSVTYLLGGSRRVSPARSSNKNGLKSAEGVRLLGRTGATRLLRAFNALPEKPAALREIIVRMVEGTALAAQTKKRNRSEMRSGSKAGARRGVRTDHFDEGAPGSS